jgi:hypothetical protein
MRQRKRGEGKMKTKTIAFLFSIGAMPILLGCSGGASKADVTQYIGMTEQEIIAILGPTSGRSDSRQDAVNEQFDVTGPDKKWLIYREEVASLPRPLRRLELLVKREGGCQQVKGETYGLDTPEEMLDAIGLGRFEIKGSNRDELGVSYSIPPYGLVQVHRPSSMQSKYMSFNVIP